MTVVVPLRTFRFTPRKARVEIDGGQVALYLPAYFGRRRWVVPAVEIGVVHLAGELPADEEPDRWFAGGIDEVYFFTSAAIAPPNVVLCFLHPQRVPPLRWYVMAASNVVLPFSVRATRSAGGATLDVVALRALDPDELVARLVEAGATRVLDPDEWLARHREVVTNPAVIEQAMRRVRGAKRLERIAFATLLATLGVMGLDELTDRDIPAALAVGVAILSVTALVLWIVSQKLAERAVRRTKQ